jgi:transcriptional regulator with XRE-family HTH domain
MREVFLGEYIKQRRQDLGLTQAQLCEGICEPVTISRLENGKQTPGRSCINALLQRLGLPDDRYFALLSQNEIEISALQKEIVSCNVRHKNAEGLAAIKKLESIIEPNDPVMQQFILRSKALLGKPDRPYSFDEKLEMLLRAIRLTVPRFDLMKINNCLYSLDEVKIINQIAIIFSENGQNERAIDVHRQLLLYVQNHFQNILQSGGLLPLIAYNYARELGLAQQYEESIKVATLGYQACIQYGQYSTLPATLSVMAECFYYTGDKVKSKVLYTQAYALCTALKNDWDCATIRAEAKERLGLEFDY